MQSLVRPVRTAVFALTVALVVARCGESSGPVGDVAEVRVTPTSIAVTAGETVTLLATAVNASGEAIDVTVTWSSDDAAVAEVNADGVVTGQLVGTAEVRATVGSVSGSAAVIVQAGPPVAVALAAPAFEIFRTELRPLGTAVTDAGGNLLDVTVAWSSSDTAVVQIDTAGAAIGIGLGSASVTARVGALTATAAVTVLARMDFAFPVVGSLNRDYYVVNYVDQAPEPGVRDFACGPKTYDGHLGTDLTLPSFVVMDSGVTVVAAAAGTVTEVQDGAFDRNTQPNSGGFGNHVRVAHRDGFESIYAHLTQNSIAVTAGQVVSPGTVLGLVGSSGNSDMPHLHIEFRRNGETVDPFGGPCGPTFSQWAAPLAYQDTFLVIGSGTTPLDLTLDLLKNPPAQVDTFTTTDSSVSLWVQLYNVRAGIVSRFDLVDPSGALFTSFQFPTPQFFSMSWWFFWVAIQGNLTQPGTWRFEFHHGTAGLIAAHDFELVAAPGPPPPPSPIRSRAGGGGPGLIVRFR